MNIYNHDRPALRRDFIAYQIYILKFLCKFIRLRSRLVGSSISHDSFGIGVIVNFGCGDCVG